MTKSCNLVVVLVVSKGKTSGTTEPVQLSQMIVAMCTLFSAGKLQEAIAYNRNDDFQQILSLSMRMVIPSSSIY